MAPPSSARLHRGDEPLSSLIEWKHLLREVDDVKTLAQLPHPSFVSQSITSRDRASVSPEDAEGWFANQDKGNTLYSGTLRLDASYFHTSPLTQTKPDGTLRKGMRIGIATAKKSVPGYVWVHSTERDGKPIDGKIEQGYISENTIEWDKEGHTLADIIGPGCVTRISCSNPSEAGKMRIYLDDLTLVDGPMPRILSGSAFLEKGSLAPPFTCDAAGAMVIYFPISFQKRCRITVEKPNIMYQIHYRQYESRIKLETFQKEMAKNESPFLEQVSSTWARKEWKPVTGPDAKKEKLTIPILKPGQSSSKEIAVHAQLGRAITEISLRVESEKIHETLRKSRLTIHFDDAHEPQVLCPLSDFFPAARGIAPHVSLFTEVTKDGAMRCRWFMPFSRKAIVTLTNHGDQPLLGELEISHVSEPWTNRHLHFHASWIGEQRLSSRPFRDWTSLEATGQGNFVGTILHVTHPTKEWWGEGKEKIFIDQERFPSHLGTGTDEYFGMGWGYAKSFTHPFVGLPHVNDSSASLYRWNLLDRIPFQKKLRFDWEIWADSPKVVLGYSAVSFWYGT